MDLLIIDPQRSFCEVVPAPDQQSLHTGELCVPGAWDDMVRVANFIDRKANEINEITITLDTHSLIHISHPIWYVDKNGNYPAPFTKMEVKDGVIVGSAIEYRTFDPSNYDPTLYYIKQIKEHMVWPPHCLIGSTGHAIVPPLFDALLRWEQKTGKWFETITKGDFPYFEEFSAFKDVENLELFENSDTIVVGGEALSHCVADSLRDFPREWMSKVILLKNGTSNVHGFESRGDEFVRDMTEMGMKTSTCEDFNE